MSIKKLGYSNILLITLSSFILNTCSDLPAPTYTDTQTSIVYDTVYVSSTLGSDNLDYPHIGLEKGSPVKTLKKGLELARAKNIKKIYLTIGTYYLEDSENFSGAGLLITNSDIQIIGGWDITEKQDILGRRYTTAFDTIVGYSEITGSNLNNVIRIENVSNIIISNLMVKGGNATNSQNDKGGGIYISNVSHSVIYVVASQNSATYGGGAFITSCSNNIISIESKLNSAIYGGGVYITNSHSNTITIESILNNASHGGGIYISKSYDNTMSLGATSNTSYWGGGVFIYASSNNNISISAYGNKAIQSGGGIYISGCIGNIININSINNTSEVNGGGGFIFLSKSNTITGISEWNIASNKGGGLYIESSSDDSINIEILRNKSIYRGGGIFIRTSTNITIRGVVSENRSEDYGCGICLISNISNKIINGIITRNWSEGSLKSVIHLYDESYLLISNCTISGLDESVGIYEETQITNHTLVNNTIITNNFPLLYMENNSQLITINDWANINNPTLIGTTPDSTNNIVTNTNI